MKGKLLILSLLFLLVISCSPGQVHLPADIEGLPVVGSAENFHALIKNTGSMGYFRGDAILAMEGSAASGELLGGASADYSTTNTQVAGVDEADIIKTDGEYLYQASGNKVYVSRIYPVETMALVKEISLAEDQHALALYVDDQSLVVIYQSYQNYRATDVRIPEYGFFPMETKTKIQVWDIRNKQDIKQTREVELDGRYNTSRKIDSVIYVITSLYVNTYEQESIITPGFRDSLDGKDVKIDLDEICYFPDVWLSEYVNFAALDLDQKEPVKVDSYLGSAMDVYMSTDNIYVAVTDWADTSVYKFGVDGTKLSYAGKGQVPGTPLNQFSMDEHNGHFRIATTRWDEQIISSGVYIMNKAMKTVGKIENIAPGERIYSARFMGDRGYMVTFELIDPLFVLDLSRPASPKILGELKIPGFSNYLHPLDENHLLGIGRDTEVVYRHGQPFVVEKGIKLAIFDVSNVAKPREKHVEILGRQGTWSEVLHNHRALFFHQGLLSFPVWIHDPMPVYDDQEHFQGAYFYQVDVETGIDYRGRVTHMAAHEHVYGNWEAQVQRVVQIESVIYTVSNSKIMAHDAEFSTLGVLALD